jgi:hypothetical protein
VRDVRLAFYKAQFDSPTDFAISFWTGLFNWFTPSYSHVEIGFYIDDEWQYFSSSIRDGGTRWKPGNKLLKNRSKWDIYESHFSDEAVNRMIKRSFSANGKNYDMLGILGFLTLSGRALNKKDSWYCSEVCWYVLTSLWKKRISPRKLSRRIKNVSNFALIE